MNKQIYKKIDSSEDNGHDWFEIIQPTHSFYKKVVCGKCGYFRRVDSDGKIMNKPCKGPISIGFR